MPAAKLKKQRSLAPCEGGGGVCVPISAASAAAWKTNGKAPECFQGIFGAAVGHRSRFSFLHDCSLVSPSRALL